MRALNDPAFGATAARFGEMLDALESATDYMMKTVAAAPTDALAGATPYLRLFSLARGGVSLGAVALAAAKARAAGDGDGAHVARIALARFFAENLATAAAGLATTVIGSAQSVNEAEAALAS